MSEYRALAVDIILIDAEGNITGAQPLCRLSTPDADSATAWEYFASVFFGLEGWLGRVRSSERWGMFTPAQLEERPFSAQAEDVWSTSDSARPPPASGEPSTVDEELTSTLPPRSPAVQRALLANMPPEPSPTTPRGGSRRTTPNGSLMENAEPLPDGEAHSPHKSHSTSSLAESRSQAPRNPPGRPSSTPRQAEPVAAQPNHAAPWSETSGRSRRVLGPSALQTTRPGEVSIEMQEPAAPSRHAAQTEGGQDSAAETRVEAPSTRAHRPGKRRPLVRAPEATGLDDRPADHTTSALPTTEARDRSQPAASKAAPSPRAYAGRAAHRPRFISAISRAFGTPPLAHHDSPKSPDPVRRRASEKGREYDIQIKRADIQLGNIEVVFESSTTPRPSERAESQIGHSLRPVKTRTGSLIAEIPSHRS